MNNKIYVGGLAYRTDTDTLSNHFSQYGNITDVAIITDRDTGRSKGFGFITFETQEEAQKALVEDGKALDGRTIKVSMATPPKGGRRTGGAGAGRRERW